MNRLATRLLEVSKQRIKREKLTLPSGVEIQVRGMLLGEMERLNNMPDNRRLSGMIALLVEDPDTSEPIYNAGDNADLEAIRALGQDDANTIMEAIGRLNGT